MKKTELKLSRTTIAILSSTSLHRIAGGRINETGPTDETCATLRYCNTDDDPYTAGCATWECSRFQSCQ